MRSDVLSTVCSSCLVLTTLLTLASDLTIASAHASSAMTSRNVPALAPAVQSELFSMGGSGLVNLWQHALRLQAKQSVGSSDIASVKPVRSIVCPHSSAMMNLVPQDTSHPLYHNSPDNAALRYSFLADCFIDTDVDPDDPAIAAPQGLTVTNVNGNNLIFKKVDDVLTVNGEAVSEVKQLSDGTRVWMVSRLLFGHGEAVRNAFTLLQQQQSGPCSSGACRPAPTL